MVDCVTPTKLILNFDDHPSIMAPVRLRHPKGVTTIQVAFDRDDFTVQDLQQEIYAASDILPSRQSCSLDIATARIRIPDLSMLQ